MPSIFISYSHDPNDSSHAQRVAGLAASLLDDGLQVFLDQNRNDDEEKVPWPIWMEDKIEVADFVLLVCTDLYLKKVRQQVAEDEGRGVCWEANLIYNRLYVAKLNTTKFVPVLFTRSDEVFIPGPLQGAPFRFVLDSDDGYKRLFAFLTGQHRLRFPKQGAATATLPEKAVKPLFRPVATRIQTFETQSVRTATSAISSSLSLKPYTIPAPRKDIRGLDWYDECDAGHFLGRDGDADRILAMLLSNPIVRLVGPSGVGKSSLVRAGLLPKIREFGWRACVIRPFEDPAQRIPSQLTAELLIGDGKFTNPLDPGRLREELARLLSSNNYSRLVLLFDQFEDIVSPTAMNDAVHIVRSLLREIYEHKDQKPVVRAVVVYRTDAEVRLGRLWQEVSGRLEGLPYIPLEGLTSAIAEQVINQAAQEQGWKLETSIPEIVRQLVHESRKLDCVSEVFPVYLQIFLKQASTCPDGCITSKFVDALGGVSGLIGKYLEQSLTRLKSRGGDWERCGVILESLSRATGTKATQSLGDIIRETGISRSALVEMLPVLINERLVRSTGHDAYEIQHDRLAAAVIQTMADTDRDAKTARDFLAAKVPAFDRARTPLAAGDLVYLYRHRHRIHPSERELLIILASMSFNRSVHDIEPILGWFWFYEINAEGWLKFLTQLERWSCEGGNRLQTEDAWPRHLPVAGLHDQLAALAKDSAWGVKEFCAKLLQRSANPEAVTTLRELAKDEDSDVRRAALKALCILAKDASLPVVLEAVKDSNFSVRITAIEALASFKREEDLALFRKIAEDKDIEGRSEALSALVGFARDEDLPLFRKLAADSDWKIHEPSARGLARLAKEEDLPQLCGLLSSGNPSVRDGITAGLAERTSQEALPLLRQLVEERNPHVRCSAASALNQFEINGVQALVFELAEDMDSGVRERAVNLLVAHGTEKAGARLRKLASDTNRRVRLAAAKALRGRVTKEDFPLLRDLVKDKDADVRVSAVLLLTVCTKHELLPLLHEVAEDADYRVRLRIAGLLATIEKEDALPLLRELVDDGNLNVSAAAVKVLAGLENDEALTSFQELLFAVDDHYEGMDLSELTALFPRDEMEQFLNQNDQDLSAPALEALDQGLYMPEWLKRKGNDQEDDLADVPF